MSSRSGCELISRNVPVASCVLDDPAHVDVRGRAPADLAGCEVPDHVHVRVVHRRQHALGRAAVERRVERRDHPVQLSEQLRGHVDLACRGDVRLHAAQDAERREPLVDRCDLLPLLLEPALAQVVRVIGHGEVLVAALHGRAGHLLDRVVPVVRPRRVAVQIAAQLAVAHELRELTAARGLQLAEVLAQLRRDRLVAEREVELVLVGDPRDLAGLHGGDAVLGDRETAAHGVLAQRDVVLLRAREVLEQVAVALRRHDAQVEAEPLVGDDRRLRLPSGHDLGHPRERREVSDKRRRVGRGGDQVEVAKRLLATADAARLGDLQRSGVLAQLRGDGEHRRQPGAQQPPALALLRLGGAGPQRGQDLLLAPRPEAG